MLILQFLVNNGELEMKNKSQTRLELSSFILGSMSYYKQPSHRLGYEGYRLQSFTSYHFLSERLILY